MKQLKKIFLEGESPTLIIIYFIMICVVFLLRFMYEIMLIWINWIYLGRMDHFVLFMPICSGESAIGLFLPTVTNIDS